MILEKERIIERILKIGQDPNEFVDLDGRRRERLISLLPYELAKPYIKPEITSEQWKPTTEEELFSSCKRDLTFAWEKALGHRGISASLMSEVMLDWVWLICGEAAAKEVEDAPYKNYGAPKLTLAEKLLDMSIDLDEYESEMAARMAEGLSCIDNCNNGCDS